MPHASFPISQTFQFSVFPLPTTSSSSYTHFPPKPFPSPMYMASSLTPLGLLPEGDAQEWELRHEDDGFTYKILKRQRLLSDPPPQSPCAAVTDPKAEEKRRRKRKLSILSKLKAQYLTEIDHWEVLSSTLQAMQHKAAQHEKYSHKPQQEASQMSSRLDHSNLTSGSLIDELLLQAEAQEAIINDVANLCDVVEAMCNAQQDEVVKSFMDLPVWGSPRELMSSLCDDV